MKKNLRLWQLWGFAFTSLVGTLLHFLYEWTGKSILVAFFSGVNESTWEHMKLLYFPLFIFALIQSRFFVEYRCFWCTKLKGTALGLALIPVLFYTYNGMFGKSPDLVNIAVFFISAAVVYIAETWMLSHDMGCLTSAVRICFAVLCLIGVLFVIFTFYPPQIPLFMDPITKGYGIVS